jgi:hypothetical protein
VYVDQIERDGISKLLLCQKHTNIKLNVATDLHKITIDQSLFSAICQHENILGNFQNTGHGIAKSNELSC